MRINGELSLLDLDEGSERKLTGDVEHFWVTYKQLDGEANLIEEVSWLAYGHHGMQANLQGFITLSLIHYSISCGALPWASKSQIFLLI